MHPTVYRKRFACLRRRWCQYPPMVPFTWEDVLEQVWDEYGEEEVSKQWDTTRWRSVLNLTTELYMWNQKRFSKTTSLLLHQHLRRGDARIYDI